MNGAGVDLDVVVAGELALLTAEVRADRERLEALLDDDFVEFGASGRRWERHEIIADLLASPSPEVSVGAMTARLVGDRVVVVTYETEADDRRVRRSSWWRERQGQWTCFFHLGTIDPASS